MKEPNVLMSAYIYTLAGWEVEPINFPGLEVVSKLKNRLKIEERFVWISDRVHLKDLCVSVRICVRV